MKLHVALDAREPVPLPSTVPDRVEVRLRGPFPGLAVAVRRVFPLAERPTP